MITKRLTKGTPLTHTEVDANFQFILEAAEIAKTRADLAFENDRAHHEAFLDQAPRLETIEGDIAALDVRVADVESTSTTSASTLSTLLPAFQMLYDEVTASFERKGLDANGVYTIIEFMRPTGTLIKRSVLTGGTSPEYSRRTETVYKADGTVSSTRTYNLSYLNGQLISETWL